MSVARSCVKPVPALDTSYSSNVDLALSKCCSMSRPGEAVYSWADPIDVAFVCRRIGAFTGRCGREYLWSRPLLH